MDYKHVFPIFPALFCFILFIFILQRKWKKNSSSKLLPGPTKLPIIGNMLHLIGSLPHHRLRDLANQYGPIMHLKLGELSTIVISSSEAAKQVMKTHDLSFADRPFSLVGKIVLYNSKNIGLSPYGDYWRQLRKICTLEILSTKRVQSFRSIREEEVSFLVKSISSSAGSPVNLSKMAFSLSNAITFRSNFGRPYEQNDRFLPLVQNQFLPIVQKVSHALEGFSVADIFPSVKFLPVVTGIKRKLEKLHQDLDSILDNIIQTHRDNRPSSRSDSKDEADDLVDVLLRLQGDKNRDLVLTTDEIKAVMLDMFLAGAETSSTIIEWAMSEMVRNPRVMEKAQAEIRQLFHQKQQLMDESILHKLNYLKLVIKETLRLHSPVPLLLPRESREKVEINGYEIPVKTKVIINAWMIGRDPCYWKEADKFYPERFLDNSMDYKGNDFEFIPFGAGRRMCPGMAFGMGVVELTLANLLYHFDWKCSNGIEPHDLDMTESFGVACRRKNELYLIPAAYSP